MRLTEAYIGCRNVDRHGSVERSSLNHRLRCWALILSLQSLEACRQIAKKCWSKEEAPEQHRLQIYTARGGTVRPQRNPYLCLHQHVVDHSLPLNIVNLPFALPITRSCNCNCSCQGLDIRQLFFCCETCMCGDRETSHPETFGLGHRNKTSLDMTCGDVQTKLIKASITNGMFGWALLWSSTPSPKKKKAD